MGVAKKLNVLERVSMEIFDKHRKRKSGLVMLRRSTLGKLARSKTAFVVVFARAGFEPITFFG